ncbi:hypothetical protein FRIGORI9N_420024 [Frigoribacterium sp. 9N]|nr:hypothetical protein FRIGORI9N_420024 [Frigoribacterium sp. 9N]
MVGSDLSCGQRPRLSLLHLEHLRRQRLDITFWHRSERHTYLIRHHRPGLPRLAPSGRSVLHEVHAGTGERAEDRFA